MVLHPVPAFSDNYIWVLHNGHEALVVDPGEASGVLAYLAQHRLALKTILVTHHHADHVGGVQALVDATGAHVVAPATEWHNPGLSAATQAQRVAQGDTLTLLGLPWQVLDVPGHTAGHVAYVCPAVAITEGTPHTTPSACTAPLLFCGDTLFSGGCGRLFEGTPAQMLASLDAMAALPDDTWVCCTHEYTLSNLRFAQAVEPDNAALAQWQRHCAALRAQQRPTLPCTLGNERLINPFLRVRTPSVRAAMVQAMAAPPAPTHPPVTPPPNDVAVFAALREWKNRF